jgi:hypothetical protein
LIEEHIA